MTVLSKQQVIQQFDNATDEHLFCVFCYDTLVKSVEKTLYCPNEMCLNERHYDKKGVEVESD